MIFFIGFFLILLYSKSSIIADKNNKDRRINEESLQYFQLVKAFKRSQLEKYFSFLLNIFLFFYFPI